MYHFTIFVLTKLFTKVKAFLLHHFTISKIHIYTIITQFHIKEMKKNGIKAEIHWII